MCMRAANPFLSADFEWKFKMLGSSKAKFFTVVLIHLNETDEHKGVIAK